jgi:hypothetical protein
MPDEISSMGNTNTSLICKKTSYYEYVKDLITWYYCFDLPESHNHEVSDIPVMNYQDSVLVQQDKSTGQVMIGQGSKKFLPLLYYELFFCLSFFM